MKKILLLLLIFVSGCTGVFAQQFDYGKIAPHPRLLLPEGGEEAIRKAIAEYPPLAAVHQRIMELCDRTLTEPPVERIKEGKRLLAISRIALKRIYYLSYAYRMTGDRKYALRAEQEMLAVSRFTDWNPTHFLDVGEMVMALAIGYDWLYDSLQPDTRRVVREAIIAKGFDAAKNTRHAWFYTAKNNWNSVCNSGLAYGALALFEEIPEVSKGIIEKCMETNPKAMVGYGPDGGYPEGFGYWGYGTSFQVMLIAALESAFGTDNGLSQAPGFMESARFMQYMTAPGGDCFCFSDSPVEAECNMMMFWFAGKAKDLSLLWIERQPGYAVCRRPFTAQPDGVLFAARFEEYRQAEEKLLVQSRRYACVYLPWRMGQQGRYLSGSERRFAFYLSCAHGCRFVYLRERRGALGDGLGYAELHHARK